MLPIALLSSGALGGGTFTFLQKDQNRHKNSNNLTIYNWGGNKGEILIGNGLQEEVKQVGGILKMVGNIDGKWKSVQAKDERGFSERLLFWWLGKSPETQWWNFFIERNSGWSIEKNKRQEFGKGGEWSEIIKSDNTGTQSSTEGSTKREISEIYLMGVSCEEFTKEIESKEKIKEYLNAEINSKNISISCKNKKLQI
ncbi:hypothetical protein [Mycoplasma suis]|uniref:hypothetical protein n=1 Tax=Mycoplasma suis TaxID=57372 RepID=UPI001E61EB55|nr:hypothetical protein [Mycoplasma suis]